MLHTYSTQFDKIMYTLVLRYENDRFLKTDCHDPSTDHYAIRPEA